MNFIVGFFLYHSDEYITFWLFTSLIEEYDLRQIYLDGRKKFKIFKINKKYLNPRPSWLKFPLKQFRENHREKIS